MKEREDYRDYSEPCLDGIRDMVEEFPDYSFGQILHSIKFHLKKDKGKSLFEASASDIYRAISIAKIKEKEKDEQED